MVLAKNGKFVNWDRATYDAEVTRMRSTRLKDMISHEAGPRHYFDSHIRQRTMFIEDEPQSTKRDDKLLGTLLHELELLGEVNWIVYDGRHDARSKEYQAAKAEAGTRALINKREEAIIYQWHSCIHECRRAREILESPKIPEQVVLWDQPIESSTGKITSVPSKLAIDVATYSFCFADLKTTKATCRSEWERELINWNYPFSAAFYMVGLSSVLNIRDIGEHPFTHIVVMKKTCKCHVWDLSPHWMRLGLSQVGKAYKQYVDCLERQQEIKEEGGDIADAWPDYQDQEHSIEPPDWILSKAGWE